MSTEKKPIKIGIPFCHPRSHALIVPYEFDTGEKGYRNFNSMSFVGMTEKEINDYIIRVVKEHYKQCKRRKENEPKEQAKLNKVIANLTGAEIEE